MTGTLETHEAPWFGDHRLFTIRGPSGAEIQVGSYGATLVSVRVPDREGRLDEVLLGFDEAGDYEANALYFGSTVGRYANRIRFGRFHLDGERFDVSRNFGDHHLHGGGHGFSHRPWTPERVAGGTHTGIRFRLHSPDGDEGFPGAVDAAVSYLWDTKGRLTVRFRATTSAPTHVSLTNHAYFNLGGAGANPPEIHGHELSLRASRFTPTEGAGIPTGEISPVAGTPLDFTSPRPVGSVWEEGSTLTGLDHNFVVDGWDGTRRSCARVREPRSGRTLEVDTTLPGIQVYTPDFRDVPGARGGGTYRGRRAVCLETQFFPDTPNHPHFPTTRLDPGQVWKHETVFTFGVE